MSTTDPGTPPPEALPTHQQLIEISQAAAQAAAEAKDAATAATEIAKAAQTKASELGLNIPAEVIQTLADTTAAATIANLRSLGAIREDPAPVVPPTSPAATPAPPTSDPSPGTSGSQAPARKRSLAERICDTVITPPANE